MQARRPLTSSKRDSNTVFSCEYCEIFKNKFFNRTPPVLLKLDSPLKKMKFSIKYFFSKWDQTHSFLRIWSHLLKKSLIETSFFVQWLLFYYTWIGKRGNSSFGVCVDDVGIPQSVQLPFWELKTTTYLSVFASFSCSSSK